MSGEAENASKRLDRLMEAYSRAKRFNHRLLIYVGADLLGSGVVGELTSQLDPKDLVFIYRDQSDTSTKLVLEELGSRGVVFRGYEFRSLGGLLGTTCGSLILDLANHMSPNDLGLAVELVGGGGFILIVGPTPESLDSWYTSYHSFFVTPPYSLDQVSKRFERRLLRKTIGRSGVVYLARGREPVVGEDWPGPEVEEGVRVEGSLFPERLYDMCASVDQRRVLLAFEEFGEQPLSMVVRANRGRGKSAVLGLALAGLAAKTGMERFLVTAPGLSNVQTLFEFALKGFEALGLKPEASKREGLYSEVKVGSKIIEYVSPYALVRLRGDLAVVDEAAGIPLPILIGVMKRFEAAVYSTTIHGYEGAGRSFSVLFMKRLKSQRNRVRELEMTQPIRYAAGDPVESWLYDVLILDAEEPELQGVTENTTANYVAADRDELFDRREDLLRQIIGLYITTHYRNRPDDIALLADSPNHAVRILETGDGRVMGAAHIAFEGGLKDTQLKLLEDRDLKGQLIPATVLRYYPHLKALGKLDGLRIVRIAVHSALQGRGYGSLLLSKIEEEFRSLDWLGSSFGANNRLLGFWLKNGYHPIAIGARRNPVSGEFSATVLKPLTNPAQKLCEELSREFRLRLIESLYDPYFEMDSELAWILLSDTADQSDVKPEFRGSQRLRLESFLKDLVIYEGASDSIRALVKAHFLAGREKRLRLDRDIERLLILKVLQGRRWETVHRIVGLKLGAKTINDLRAIVQNTVKKMCEEYL